MIFHILDARGDPEPKLERPDLLGPIPSRALHNSGSFVAHSGALFANCTNSRFVLYLQLGSP